MELSITEQVSPRWSEVADDLVESATREEALARLPAPPPVVA